MARRTGLLLVNLGTPDAPDPRSVRRYLREFLSDPRVIDIPWLWRKLLVEVLILPFRPRQSAEAYRKVWTERGSPLMFHSRDLADKVAAAVGPDVVVELAMRYQRPSIAGALERLRRAGVSEVTIFPLFPQYASSSTGSAVEKILFEAGRRWNVPSFRVIPPFYQEPAFIDAFAAVARPVLDEFRPDHVLFSYHGLPERQIVKSDESGGEHCLRSATCCETPTDANRTCYRHQCFMTTAALAPRLGLAAGRYEVGFQSRLGRSPWIRPYTDLIVRELAGKGVKRLAVLCPAFVADCLETLEEIGMRAREDFIEHGGEDLRLVPSLNAHEAWVHAVVELSGCAAPTAAPR
ncbi:MAG TPA: ferrochelatase [Planctomycetota bacterium]|nr:ferrochelatase [Planctomycetota bacterium]